MLPEVNCFCFEIHCVLLNFWLGIFCTLFCVYELNVQTVIQITRTRNSRGKLRLHIACPVENWGCGFAGHQRVWHWQIKISILHVPVPTIRDLGPVSISDKTSYRKISQSLEAPRFVFRIVRSLWNLAGTSAALLPRYLSNLKAIRTF